MTEPVAVKAVWLNVPFFFGRNLVLALALFTTCYAFAGMQLRDSVPPDDERDRARRNRLAVIVLFLWLITVSLWGFDLVMALDPIWYSGLFGGYFAVSTLYTTFCLLAILTIRANARGVASIPPAAVQDVAKLQFAMSIMWMYFFWSQYLVIWYGNVPVETRFFVARFFVQPWQTLAWVGCGLADPVRVPAQAVTAAAPRHARCSSSRGRWCDLPRARPGRFPAPQYPARWACAIWRSPLFLSFCPHRRWSWPLQPA